ncbi:PQQ-dependent dehydrogenase, methanol/ethanol family [Zestomonas insulae]|nr:PQQ-dependent dehydrogenase, methanol/ethanol family [Pseudomonas insulae]
MPISMLSRLAGLCAGLALCLAPSVQAAIDGAQIAAGQPGVNWLSYGRTYSEQRFSPLEQIDRESVGRLGLAWAMDVPEATSLVSTPLVKDGVIYFSASFSVVYAVDARSGKTLWRFDPQVTAAFRAHNPARQRMYWGMNRGLAMWGDKVFVGTGDGRLIGIDMASGKQVWSTQTTDPETHAQITGAPLAFNGKVLIGFGGADNGPLRGYVTAYDAETGKQAWRFHTVPGNPADGFENQAMAMAAKTWTGEWWKHGGGGTAWNSLTYDPQFNRVYIGTGNGAPWNRKIRSPGGGDNLFLSSIVALDADTGAYAWHYQTTPGEQWDYNSAMDMVLAELTIDGQPRQVLMHAPKNGFFYVLDRATGKLISAEKLGKVTWAERIDLATGRPVEVPGARYESGEALIWPGPPGRHSWHPMSFNPDTGLVYIPTLDIPGYYNDKGIDPLTWQHKRNTYAFGVNVDAGDIPKDAGSSALVAWDPLAQRERWRRPTAGAWPGGTLSTAGGLVFQGQADGHLVAFDAATGETRWQFQAQRGISAPPISYSVDGRQYVAVLVGWGGGGPLVGGSLFAQHGWSFRDGGRRLLTFALDAKGELPDTPHTPVVPLDRADLQLDAASVARGEALYATTCQTCHGHDAISGGGAPDLRASAMALYPQSLSAVVRDGALQAKGMPQFDELGDAELEAIYQYLRDRARAKQPSPPKLIAPEH